MKFTAATLLGILSLAGANLRAGAGTGTGDVWSSGPDHLPGKSSCHAKKAKSDCTGTVDEDTGGSCVWCECAAVPPVCVSPDEASGLPPGVFDCGSEKAAAAENENQPPKEKVHPYPSYDFGLQDGPTVQLREKVTESGTEDAEFCDASSKSISGYMDLKGSKVRFSFVFFCFVGFCSGLWKDDRERSGMSERIDKDKALRSRSDLCLWLRACCFSFLNIECMRCVVLCCVVLCCNQSVP